LTRITGKKLEKEIIKKAKETPLKPYFVTRYGTNSHVSAVHKTIRENVTFTFPSELSTWTKGLDNEAITAEKENR